MKEVLTATEDGAEEEITVVVEDSEEEATVPVAGLEDMKAMIMEAVAVGSEEAAVMGIEAMLIIANLEVAGVDLITGLPEWVAMGEA